MKRLVLCFLLACSSNVEVVHEGAPGDVPNTPGDPLAYPRAACGAGMRAALGDTACVPVGPTCGEGFTADASGFGCAAILPADACTGSARPAIGQTACVPVGDCSVAFPPAGATLVATTDSLATAIANAPAGAVLALADGDHTISEAATKKSVTLVGRCPDKARLVPDTAAAHGIQFIGGTVVVRGVTFSGFNIGIKSALTANVTVEDSVFDGLVFRGLAADQGGTLTVRHSLLKNMVGRSASETTVAIAVGAGGTATIEDSAFVDNEDGAFVTTDGLKVPTKGTLTRVVIQHMKSRGDGGGGSAVRAFEGTHLDIVDSVITESIGSSIVVYNRNGPSFVTMKGSVVTNTQTTTAPDEADQIGSAVGATHGGSLAIENSTISDSKVIGLYASDDGTKVSCSHCAIVRTKRSKDNVAIAASVTHGADLTLEDSALADFGGVGIGGFEKAHLSMARTIVTRAGYDIVEGLPAAAGFSFQSGGVAEIHDSAFVDVGERGVAAGEAGTRVTVDNTFMGRFDQRDLEFGHGFVSVDGSHLEVKASVVTNLPGVAFICAAGGGYLASSLLVKNGVGVHAQDGSTISEVGAAPDQAADTDLSVVTDTKFDANGARTGTGEVPLPSPSF